MNTESKNLPPKYRTIVSATEAYFDKHGDSFLGVGWTKKQEHADMRYKVMLDVIKPASPHSASPHSATPQPVSLLDFGCGLSHLYEYLRLQQLDHIHYSGLDISEKFMAASKQKFPQITYYFGDILSEPLELPQFDYVVLNGLFTLKRELSFDEMFAYVQALIRKVFPIAKVGIAFNVMSKQVEWERDDLFHLPFDLLATFLTQEISRDFVFRHDYHLYEYTTYVYHRELVG